MALTAQPELKMLKPVLPSMQVPLVKSGLFHLLVVGFLSVGIPFVSKEPLTISPPISVEIVDVSELTTTPRISPPVKPREPEKPPQPAQKKEAAPKVDSSKPPDLSKPAPPDIDTIEDIPDVAPPEPIKRKPMKKPEPPKPKPEVTKKAQPKPQEDDFQSLLRNIIPDEAESSEGEEALDPDAQAESGQLAKLADQLTMSEQDALRRQLANCWTIMAGAKYAEDLIVEVRVEMRRDRTVQNASILDNGRYNRDTHFRAAADAAIRALRNPKCSPLELPPDKYDQWKTVLIRFDPRDML
ncbi:MAG: energy transducer TonB [Alphaproteobacteria bacterium]